MMLVASGSFPNKLVLGWCDDFVFAAVIDVLELTAGTSPFKRLDVRCRASDLEYKVDEWPRGKKTAEGCVFVEPVKVCEIALEATVVQQRQQRFGVELQLIESITGKHVG